MVQATIEEKLDNLLRYFKNNQLNDVIISKSEAKAIEFDQNDINNKIDFIQRDICIDKLIEEKLLKDKGSTTSKYIVKITIDGLLFINDGGYVGKKRKSTITINNELIQNWTIAIGALLAGTYTLFQMLQGLLNYFCNCQ